MPEPRILREDRAGLCVLTLNRPDKLNALDTETFAQLEGHLLALEDQTETVGCVLILGSGRGFCAGADLSALGKAPIDPRYKPAVIDRLGRLPQPVVAAIRGVCYTGGLELALACNFIVADHSARFADTHGKWGLVGAWGMMQRLPRRIGGPAAQRMMMTGRTVGASEALDIGLVDLLAGEGDLEATAAALCSEILENSWHTNFAIKRVMIETDGMPLSAALAVESYRYPGNAPDHQERIARFSKR